MVKRSGDADPELEQKIVEVILGTTLACWLVEYDEMTGTALLNIPGMAHIQKDGTVTTGKFSVKININEKKVYSSSFGGSDIGLSDALALLVVADVGHTHPSIHAFANWGINPESKISFLHKMALCTIRYNDFGMFAFPSVAVLLNTLGVLRYTTHDIAVLSVYHGHHTVPPHPPHFKQLANHSTFLHFIAEVRATFMEEFEKYQVFQFNTQININGFMCISKIEII